MNEETVTQLRDLARGDSRAAFKSAAQACGMTSEEADLVWRADGQPVSELVEADVREAGMELRAGGDAWLTTTEPADLEDYR
jgi:hypothetical protein